MTIDRVRSQRRHSLRRQILRAEARIAEWRAELVSITAPGHDPMVPAWNLARRVPVRHVPTGRIFASFTEAAQAEGVNVSTMSRRLSNPRSGWVREPVS